MKPVKIRIEELIDEEKKLLFLFFIFLDLE